MIDRTAVPLILTLRMDGQSQEFFDRMRTEHFPKERNVLKAHLTLFHQLPETGSTVEILEQIKWDPFELEANVIKFLGAGVAYGIESAQLLSLRKKLVSEFERVLIPQDRQGYRPHVTIQNKVLPQTAKALKEELEKSFSPFKITATGLDLWRYLGGPWEHLSFYPFSPA